MHDHDPQPWQCDDCGHVNNPDSPVCRCYFWTYDPEEMPLSLMRELQASEQARRDHMILLQWERTNTGMSLGDFRAMKQEEKPAPDLSHWLTVSIQDQEEESRERWSNAQPCPQCGTPMLYQDELARGLCPMCWSKNRKEQ